MEKVFISYRRQNSWSHVRALYDRLAGHFGEDKIFMDLDDIPLGTDFVDVLDHNLSDCKAMLVVIDAQWTDIRDSQGNRRLDNPHDFVRLEVATALKRNVPVIPILIDGTPMPSESALPDDLKLLPRRQALELNSRNYDHSVQDLTRALEHYIGTPEPASPVKPAPVTNTATPSAKPAWYKRPLIMLPLLLVAGLLLFVTFLAPDVPPDIDTQPTDKPDHPAQQSSTDSTPLPDAGFDCSAAHSSTEKAICAYPVSRRIDAQLQEQYSRMLNLLPPDFRNDFRKDQQNWLRERDAYIKAYCLNTPDERQGSCIVESYQQRLNTLQAMQSRQFVQALVIDPPSNIRYKPDGSVRCQAATAIHIHLIRKAVRGADGDRWYWTNHCGQNSWGVIHETQINL